MHRIAAVVAGLSLAFVGTSATFAATINVPADQPTIAAAISASVNGDVINIAAGTYFESSLNPNGKAITIQGTLNGDGSLATTINAFNELWTGAAFDVDSGEGNGTVIQNLVIRGGANGVGGGISCTSSSPIIRGCMITDNAGLYEGGGIYCYNASPIIEDCTITDNRTSAVGGGGIACSAGSNPTITGCTITFNTSQDGGGIYCSSNSSPTISDCTISGNSASNNGGGFSCNNSNPAISGCTIMSNTAINGAGIYCEDSNPTITNCTTLGNTANNNGGGISCYNSSPTISVCTIISNTASNGGGMSCNNSNPTITGCIISDNTASSEGGGIHHYDNGSSSSILSGTVVCGNNLNQIYGAWTDAGGNTVQFICPLSGACCAGSEDFCVPGVLEVVCIQWGGEWLGEATSCDDCPEPDPTGACCVSSGCHALTETACTDMGGTWLGEDASCDDCAPTCQGDANADGTVDVFDLLKVIDGWGLCD